MGGRRRRPLRWLTFIFGTPVAAILLVGAVTGGAASCLGLAGVADAPSKTAITQIPRQLLPIFEQVGAQYHIPWEVLAGIAANECNLGRSADPSCTLQPGATGPGVANAAGASGLMQIGIGGASGDTYQRLQPYLSNPQLGPHDPTTAVQLAALTLLKLKGAPQDAPIAAYAPYVTAYNGTGPAAVAYGQRVIADAQGYQGNGTTGLAGGCQTTAGNFANPLAGDTHVVAERIDMGVDYADPDPEPIDAIGAGTVTYAGPQGGGWQPNCINYTLDSPPTPTERYVYVCEHITPSVSTGQTIQPGQQIAKFIPDGGIETGWAAAPGTPVSTRQPRSARRPKPATQATTAHTAARP